MRKPWDFACGKIGGGDVHVSARNLRERSVASPRLREARFAFPHAYARG